MNVSEAIIYIENKIKSEYREHIKSYSRDILCRVLNVDRTYLIRESTSELNQIQIDILNNVLDRMNNNEPIAYIFGNTNFYGLEIYCDNSVLIPRPDSEILLESILKYLNIIAPSSYSNLPINIFELGTGTGAIPLALLLNFNKQPLHIESIDIDYNAISLARKNIDLYKDKIASKGHKIELEIKDFRTIYNNIVKQYEIIFSNPPYISIDEYNNLDKSVKDYENIIALTDGGDGLDFYRKLAIFANENLKRNGYIIVEHGYQQANMVRQIFENMGLIYIESALDYAGHTRVTVAKKR